MIFFSADMSWDSSSCETDETPDSLTSPTRNERLEATREERPRDLPARLNAIRVRHCPASWKRVGAPVEQPEAWDGSERPAKVAKVADQQPDRHELGGPPAAQQEPRAQGSPGPQNGIKGIPKGPTGDPKGFSLSRSPSLW